MLYPEIFRGDVRRKSFLGLINVKNIEGNLKNVKNVFRQILITTGMYVKVKTHTKKVYWVPYSHYIIQVALGRYIVTFKIMQDGTLLP